MKLVFWIIQRWRYMSVFTQSSGQRWFSSNTYKCVKDYIDHALTTWTSVYKTSTVTERKNSKVFEHVLGWSFLSAVMASATFIEHEQSSIGKSICCWQAWSHHFFFIDWLFNDETMKGISSWPYIIRRKGIPGVHLRIPTWVGRKSMAYLPEKDMSICCVGMKRNLSVVIKSARRPSPQPQDDYGI